MDGYGRFILNSNATPGCKRSGLNMARCVGTGLSNLCIRVAEVVVVNDHGHISRRFRCLLSGQIHPSEPTAPAFAESRCSWRSRSSSGSNSNTNGAGDK
mmetsp:Transcript_58013/g.166355  ORF Transcript_58013/g.166355 Transcript_58013/m.166355 type:complete len:99 (+) Transcript_58013:1286-1582(+)